MSAKSPKSTAQQSTRTNKESTMKKSVLKATKPTTTNSALPTIENVKTLSGDARILRA